MSEIALHSESEDDLIDYSDDEDEFVITDKDRMVEREDIALDMEDDESGSRKVSAYEFICIYIFDLQ